MPSLFETDYAAAALPALLAVRGIAATYTPVTGAAVSLTGISGPVTRERVHSLDGTREVQVRQFTITTDPTSQYGGVASPTIHATVTIGSEIWDVDEVLDGPGLATLRLVREPSAERAGPHFRHR